MLENWCWEPKILSLISSHYKTQEPLSGSLIKKIVASRYLNTALFYLRQLWFSHFDLLVHHQTSNPDQTPLDYTKMWNEMSEDIGLMGVGDHYPEYVGLVPLVGGYDAGLYGYLYSLVYAADMYGVYNSMPLISWSNFGTL
jgi:Zn-dependent oligopeptidase